MKVDPPQSVGGQGVERKKQRVKSREKNKKINTGKESNHR